MEITLSEEYFHSSTLSMLFLLVNLGLAPTGKKKTQIFNKALHYISILGFDHLDSLESHLWAGLSSQAALCLSFIFAVGCNLGCGPMMFGVDMRLRPTTRQAKWIRVCLPALLQRGKCRTWVWISAWRIVYESKYHREARQTVQILQFLLTLLYKALTSMWAGGPFEGTQ